MLSVILISQMHCLWDLHLLHCHNTHYTLMHETVKRSLAQCLRNLFNSQLASLSVHVEAPVNRFAPLRNPEAPEGKINRADIVLVLSGSTQQDVYITDIVSALARSPNRQDGFYYDLTLKEKAKRSEYSKYLIPSQRFFPLAFGRTNILSRDTLRFCDIVGTYFPKSLKVTDKIRACFSRAITSGVAATLNDEVRRLQLAALNSVAFSMVPPAPDRCARQPPPKTLLHSSAARPSALSNSSASLNVRLATILSSGDSTRASVNADAPASQSSSLLSQRSEVDFY